MALIKVLLSSEQHSTLGKLAEGAGLPLATWARVELLKSAVAAMPVAPAASNAPKPVGRPAASNDEFLDRFSDERFASGQRRYRFIAANYPEYADDERAHVENEKDLLAFKRSNKAKLVDRPHFDAYHAEMKNRA